MGATRKVGQVLPFPVKVDSRICFGIMYFTSEADADLMGKHVMEQGRTYNGGYMHGVPCGREASRDYVDAELGQLYAVTN
jgi:hypothetical protein